MNSGNAYWRACVQSAAAGDFIVERKGVILMYCTKKITDELTWIGADDRRLAMFEGVYSVPDGVSYNSYFLDSDGETAVFDTVDKAVYSVFLENVEHMLAGRPLTYLFVHHMEPDHSAALIELIRRHPELTIVCNAKTQTMMKQFFNLPGAPAFRIVSANDTVTVGRHSFRFVMAPMVHWPEVMVSFDETDGILFSADAFGTFGALNGAIFADEVDFERDYLDEARRYYCNIVGKYGNQVQALLKKAATLPIRMICPLHGFVWRGNTGDYIDKYMKWSSYMPETTGVMIAYASVYGNTENTASILSCRLRDAGIRTVMYDVSVTPSSDIVAAAFQYSHLVFASTTYNAGIFISMEELLRDIAAHNLQNRTVAFIENGSWAPTSGGLMREIIGTCRGMTILNETLTIHSSLKEEQLASIDALVAAIAATMPVQHAPAETTQEAAIEPNAFFKLSYGLFVLTAAENGKDNGCIVNTVQMLTNTPKRILVSVNKQNLTHDMILRTGLFNVSVLTENTPFRLFEQFGFQSGRTADKFAGDPEVRSASGIRYVPEFANAYFSARVISSADYGTHTLFVAEVTEAKILSDEPSVTYDYYFQHIKPKPQPSAEKKKGFVCKICGYVYEGDKLPDDFICPLCKHGAEDFEPIA